MLDDYLKDVIEKVSKWELEEEDIYNYIVDSVPEEKYCDSIDRLFTKPSNFLLMETIIILEERDCRIAKAVEVVYFEENSDKDKYHAAIAHHEYLEQWLEETLQEADLALSREIDKIRNEMYPK